MDDSTSDSAENKKMENSLNISLYVRSAAPFLGRQWPYFLGGGLCMLAMQVATLIIPSYQGAVVNDIVAQNTTQFYTDVYRFVAFSSGIIFFGALSTTLLSVGGRLVKNDVKEVLFQRIITQDIPFFDSNNSGDLNSRISSDATQMVQPLQQLSSSTLSSLITLVGALVMCLYTSWRLSVLAFVSVGPIVLIYREYSILGWSYTATVFGALGFASSHSMEIFRNARTVKSFSLEAMAIARHQALLRVGLKAGIKDALFSAGSFSLVTLIDRSISILILIFGGSFILTQQAGMTSDSSELNIGKLVTFQIYWGMLQSSYSSLANSTAQITRAAGASQRVVSILRKKPVIESSVLPALLRGGAAAGTDSDSSSSLASFSPPTLEFHNVVFRYALRPGNVVLKGISFTIPAATRTAIVGASGSGKSTIMALIQRFYDPEEGEIRLDSRPLRDYKPLSDMRKMMGVVSQDSAVFNLSIRDNILIGVGERRESISQEQIEEAAKLAHAHDFIMDFEDGYSTLIGEAGTRLSGGQRQRLAIARVLIRRPALLLLDEATSSLDAESEHQVQQGLDELLQNSKSTSCIVAHRLSTIRDSDQILVMNEGKIVERGTHTDLLTRENGHYKQLIQRQLESNNLESNQLKEKEI